MPIKCVNLRQNSILCVLVSILGVLVGMLGVLVGVFCSFGWHTCCFHSMIMKMMMVIMIMIVLRGYEGRLAEEGTTSLEGGTTSGWSDPSNSTPPQVAAHNNHHHIVIKMYPKGDLPPAAKIFITQGSLEIPKQVNFRSICQFCDRVFNFRSSQKKFEAKLLAAPGHPHHQMSIPRSVVIGSLFSYEAEPACLLRFTK